MAFPSPLAKFFRAILVAAVLCALPGNTAVISESALRDIRIDVVFEPGSGYENKPAAQQDFINGAELAMRMWESIFPTMRVFFVGLHDKSSANLTFLVGNYAGVEKGDCGKGFGAPGGLWDACSFSPDENGNIAGGIIYFNSHGYDRYLHERFTFFSRDRLYKSYEPATEPPFGYDSAALAGGKGYIDGRFKDNAGHYGANHIVFHEFGHSVGLSHVDASTLGFYGIPHPPGVPAGAFPNEITPDRSLYPLLPEKYFGGGTPTAPWVSDIRPLGMNLSHMLYLTNKPAGLPGPNLDIFNFFVVGKDDYNGLLEKFHPSRLDYPNTKGIIRLQKLGGAVSLTSSWKQAITSAQLDRTGSQSDPFYVVGVYKGDQTQKVASGAFHTLVIRNDGTLWGCGANDQGQLGNGTLTNSSLPKPIGSNLLGTGQTWLSVAAGENFSLALRSDNALFAWGSRSSGQVGDGVIGGSPVTTPKQVPGSWAVIKAGPLHSLGIKTDGTLWGWGSNSAGQLGIGNNTNQAAPVQEYFKLPDWISVSAGSNHSTGMRVGGTVWAWGNNDYGSLGSGNNTSTNYPVVESYYSPFWLTSEAGAEHTVAMSSIGDMWVWGRNQLGQLGTASSNVSSNTPLYSGSGYVMAAAGHWHNASIKKDGSLWSWGSNSRGQLGGNLAAGTTRTTPVQEATYSTQWLAVYPGKEQTLAMRTDGSLYAWGNNSSGQLGTGSTSSNPVLSPVPTKFGIAPTLSLKVGLTASDEPSLPTQPFHFREKPGSRPSIYLLAEASGSIEKIEIFNGTTLIGTATTPSFKHTVSNLARGQYKITARLTVSTGEVLNSTAAIVNVHWLDIFASTNTANSVNLSTEAGSAGDWVQWGYNSTSPWITRKNPAIPLIKPNTTIPGPLVRKTDASSGFTWTNGPALPGSKTYVASSSSGDWIHEFPASTTKRTVKAYVRVSPGAAIFPNFRLGGYWEWDIPSIMNTGTTVLNKTLTFEYTSATTSDIAKINLIVGRAQMQNPPPGTSGLQAIVYK